MAVVPTGAIYKSLFFDGEDSRDYGVYITGQAVYNAPEREVEMVSIPGRSGALALDRGRFENIEVTYPAGIYANNEADFAEAISDFRNLLCSRRGYVRLQDEYNPNEYRLAIYKSGLEVEPATLRAGEFEIIFDCKPQRYLTSGEEPITIGEWRDTETVSGDIVEVDNPDGDLGVKSLSVTLEPIQSGSGTPSPSNPRPISGRTECVTSISGKNLFNDSNSSNGYLDANGSAVSASGWKYTDYIRIAENTAYTFKSGSSAGASPRTIIYGRNKNLLSAIPTGDRTFTTDSGAFYIRISYRTTDTNIQLEVGTTATPYEPYEGETYTTTLGRTVYGGTLDVVSGELVVDRAMVLASSLTWTLSGTDSFYANKTDKKRGASTAISSHFDVKTYDTSDRILLQNTGYTSKTALIDYFTAQETAGTPVQLCYELATPQTYTLTPTEVSLLTGTNNVWSEGDVTLEYGMLPNLVINPTLFESSPLIVVEGEGNFSINDYEITVNGNEPIGTIQLARGGYIYAPIRFSTDALNTGDEIYVSEAFVEFEINDDDGIIAVQSYTKTTSGYSGITIEDSLVDGEVRGRISYGRETFVLGTARNITSTVTYHVVFANNDTADVEIQIIYKYAGADSIVLDYDCNISTTSMEGFAVPIGGKYGNVTAYSTILSGGTTILDCEIGEAYKYDDGTLIPLNSFVSLGSDLPTLVPGANTITFDNTITDLKVTPRWWKI